VGNEREKTTTKLNLSLDGMSQTSGHSSGIEFRDASGSTEGSVEELRVALDRYGLASLRRDVTRLSSDTFGSGNLKIFNKLRILLEGLDLITAADYTDPVLSEEVVGTVRVIVDSAEESGSSIFAKTGLDESASSRVFVDEGRDVVDEAGDDDELTGLASFGEVVPGENGKVVRRLGPVDLVGLLLKSLHLHSDLSSTNLVIGCKRRERQ